MAFPVRGRPSVLLLADGITDCTRDIDPCVIAANNHTIHDVDKFKYLGSYVFASGDLSREIEIRIATAKSKLHSFSSVWHSIYISMPHKMEYLDMFIFSIVRYGSECWHFTAPHVDMIDKFERYCYRLLTRVRLSDKVRNERLYQKVGLSGCRWVRRMLVCKLNYFRNICRDDDTYKTHRSVLFNPPVRRPIDVPAPPLVPRPRPPRRWGQDIIALLSKSSRRAFKSICMTTHERRFVAGIDAYRVVRTVRRERDYNVKLQRCLLFAQRCPDDQWKRVVKRATKA